MLPSVNNVRITKLVFVQTGTYNDLLARPYQTDITDQNTILRLQEATEGGTNVTSAALATVAGSVIRPAAHAEGVIPILNGWSTPRLRFFMEIEYDAPMGGVKLTQILCGYTDYVGVTPSGNVDPNMRLFFNSSIKLRHVMEMSPVGRVVRPNVVEATHLLHDPVADPETGFSQHTTYTMRPEDLFNRMEHSLLPAGEVRDLRSELIPSQRIKKSRLSNNYSPTYLSQVLQAYQSVTAEDDYTASEKNIFRQARGQVREGLLSDDMALRLLSNYSQLNECGSLTYGELLAIDPTLEGRAIFNLPGPIQQQTMHRTGQTEYWDGPNAETVAATILANALPALMMDHMLAKLAISATNEVIGGGYDIRVLGAVGFSDKIDLSPYVENLLRRFEIEILRDLTRNNEFSINLLVHADIIGETRIRIELNGQGEVEYVMPSFCNALVAPVLTRNQQTVAELTSDVEGIMGSLSTHYLPPVPANPWGGNNGFNGNNGGQYGNSDGFSSVV